MGGGPAHAHPPLERRRLCPGTAQRRSDAARRDTNPGRQSAWPPSRLFVQSAVGPAHNAGRAHLSTAGETERAVRCGAGGDRKSVVWGRRVSVRVDLGGRRIITKKKKK